MGMSDIGEGIGETTGTKIEPTGLATSLIDRLMTHGWYLDEKI